MTFVGGCHGLATGRAVAGTIGAVACRQRVENLLSSCSSSNGSSGGGLKHVMTVGVVAIGIVSWCMRC